MCCTSDADLCIEAAVQMTSRAMGPARARRGGMELDRRLIVQDEGADRIQAMWGTNSPRPSTGAVQSLIKTLLQILQVAG